MKLLPRFFLVLVFAGQTLFAADGKLDLKPNDKSVLERQTGQVVELHLKSGEKMGGKVERFSEKLVHLSQLTGAEFFEAVVEIDAISAVVVRAKGSSRTQPLPIKAAA